MHKIENGKKMDRATMQMYACTCTCTCACDTDYSMLHAQTEVNPYLRRKSIMK